MLAFVLALLACQDFDTPRGPFEAHGPTIYQLSSTDFIPNVPLSLKAQEVEIHTSADWTNTFVETNDHLNYYETLHIRPSIWYGVDDNLTVGLSQPVSMVGGGYMDGFINAFHSAFGIKSDRIKYPENKFLVQDNSGFHQPHSSVIAGDLMLSFQYKLISEDHYGLNIGDQLQFPTGGSNNYFQHKRFGAGVFVSGYFDIENFRLFSAVDLAYVGDGQILWQKLRPMQVSVLSGVDYKVAPWLSIVFQVTTTSGPASFDHYDSWASEAEGGFRVKLAGNLFWEIGATEHLIRYDNNADFGVHTAFILKY